MSRIKCALLLSPFLVAVLAAAPLVAGEPPRFDASSEGAMLESTRKVGQQLPPERRESLAAAIIKLGMADGAQSYALPDGTQQTGIPPEKIRQILDGKTAEQVIALADRASSPVTSVEFDRSK